MTGGWTVIPLTPCSSADLDTRPALISLGLKVELLTETATGNLLDLSLFTLEDSRK